MVRVLWRSRDPTRLPAWKEAQPKEDDVRPVVTRPRFPVEWADETMSPPELGVQLEEVRTASATPQRQRTPAPRRRKGLRIVAWTFLVIGASLLVSEQLAPVSPVLPPAAPEAPAHRYWVEGIVEALRERPTGQPSITVRAVTGKPTSAEMDFERTSVVYDDVLLNIAHLKLGQRVRLMHEAGRARVIEITAQPVPTVMP